MHVTTPGAGQRIVGASKRLWPSIRQDSLSASLVSRQRRMKGGGACFTLEKPSPGEGSSLPGSQSCPVIRSGLQIILL